MKNTILSILRKGFYNGKKYALADIRKKLWPLRFILECDVILAVRCNNNPFWSPEN